MNAGTLEIQLLANVARLQADMTQAKGVVGSAMADISRAAGMATAALGALGVGLSVGAMILFGKHTLDTIARMKDLGQEAGTTASAISRFEAPARMAGSSLDFVAGAMFKMTKSLMEARDPQSKAAQALAAIGLSTEKFKGLKPDEIFEMITRASAKYSDGLEKNAVFMELFNKGGREMKRVAEEIAASKKLVATVTDEEAEAADRLQDQMVELKMNSEKFWRGIVAEGLPAMNDMLKAFIDGRKEGNLYTGMVDALSAAFDRLFGKTPQLQLHLVNEEIEAHKKSVKDMDALWAKLGMKINPEGQLAQAKAMNELLARRAGIEKQIWDAEFAAQNKRAVAGQTPGKPTPNFDPAAEAARLAAARKAEAEATKAAKDALDAYTKAAQTALDMDAEIAAQIAALTDKRTAAILSTNKVIAQIEFETTALRMSSSEREIAIALRALETSGINKQDAAYAGLADRIRESIVAQQGVRAEIEASAAAQRNSASAWEDLADRVIHGFGNMREALRQFGKDLLAMFAKKYFLQMVAGVTGNSALGSIAGQVGQGTAPGSLLSGASTLSSLGSLGTAGAWLGGATGLMTGGAAYAAAVPGLTAFGAGSQAAMLAAQTGAFGAAGTAATAAAGAGATGVGSMAGAMSGVYSALAAIPVWGWIAMAVIAIGAYIAGGHKGGPKGGGSFIGEFDAGGTMGRSQFGERLYTPSGADPLMRQLVEGTSAGYMQALRLMGGTSGGMTFGLGMDTDPEGTAANRITSMVRDALGQTVFSTLNRDIGRDEENIGPEMQLETQRMILAALQASELPAAVAEVLNGLVASTASGEEITAAIQAAQTVYSIIQALSKSGITGLDINALKAMQRQGESLTDTFNALVTAQASYYDLFFSEEEKKLRLQDELLAEFEAFGVALPTTREAFRALVEGLDLSTESGAQFYRRLMELAPAFAQLVPTLAAVSSIVATIPPSRYGPYGPTEMDLYYMPEAVAARAELVRLAEALKDARDGLRDWLDGLLLNEALSPLTPMQQLEEARRQYEKTLALAKGGDLGAMGQLSGSSETYLRIAREIFASSSAYNEIFRDVYASVGGVAGMTPADVNTRLAAALPQNSPLASRADMQEINTNILTLITVIASGLSVNDPENKALLEELNANLRRTKNSGVLA